MINKSVQIHERKSSKVQMKDKKRKDREKVRMFEQCYKQKKKKKRQKKSFSRFLRLQIISLCEIYFWIMCKISMTFHWMSLIKLLRNFKQFKNKDSFLKLPELTILILFKKGFV